MNVTGVRMIHVPPPPPPSGPPIECTTKFKYGGQEYQLNADTLVKLGILGVGEGAHSTVQKMRHQPSGVVMAVKMIPFTSDAEDERRLLRQLKLSMDAANCPYVVQFFGAFFFDGNVCICMEVMDISLKRFYKQVHELHGNFHEDVLRVIAFSVLTALEYLRRELKVIHRDVKPSNILLSRNGCVKICDFGISGHLVNSVAMTLTGSQNYMAPEKVNPSPGNEGFSIKSDVWSFGITMAEVATGRFPYKAWNGLFEQIREVVEGDAPRLPSGEFSEQFEDFVGGCLQKKPEDRPRYEALLKHAFVSHLMTTPIDISTFVSVVLDAAVTTPCPSVSNLHAAP